MKILGLHFGHDAGIALIEDGRVTFLAHAERLLRRKKMQGLSYGLLRKVLDRAGVQPEDIDFCAISTTQGIDIVLDTREPFRIEIARHPNDKLRSAVADLIPAFSKLPPATLRSVFDPGGESPQAKTRREKRVGTVVADLGIPAKNVVTLPSFNRGLMDPNSPLALMSGLRDLGSAPLPPFAELTNYVADFNFPATLHLGGHSIPAAFISHHAAHAASVFYQSAFETSAIMTLDGGTGFFEGGLFWAGVGNRIVPLRAHYLELGRLYLYMAHNVLRLGGSAEGKMMGLAPYGTPAFFDPRYIGNACDALQGGLGQAGLGIAEQWSKHIDTQVAGDASYATADLGNPDKMTTPINADIAASVQKLFEETMLAAVGQLPGLLARAGLSTDALSLSGGCMLNCPTNSRIFQETPFKDVYAEPACDDGGLPGGAALWVYYNLMGHPRTPVAPVKAGLPYQGLALDKGAVEAALQSHQDRITVSRPDNVAGEAARRLVAGQVIGWFEGRSEIGPRALGHRSIVADPRSEETWRRVNTIKGRELWRPLAPSVLAEHATNWFTGLPAESPFMMFVGTATGAEIPAITHIDGTARVQTVTKECGGYYDLISQFNALTGCAVVLNTSMNGPGEPIAEFPDDAVRMLLDGRFDCLVMEGALVERAS